MEINELFSHFEGLVKELTDKVDASNKRMDDILKLYHDEEDRWNDEQDSKAWHDDFSEKLKPYEEAYKAFEDDDEDLVDTLRKKYNEKFKGMDKEEYIAKVIPKMQRTLDKLREVLGTSAVTVSSEAETPEEPAEKTVVTEGENMEESAEENAEVVDEVNVVSDEDKDEDKDEDFDVESFEKELQEYKDSHNL